MPRMLLLFVLVMAGGCAGIVEVPTGPTAVQQSTWNCTVTEVASETGTDGNGRGDRDAWFRVTVRQQCAGTVTDTQIRLSARLFYEGVPDDSLRESSVDRILAGTGATADLRGGFLRLVPGDQSYCVAWKWVACPLDTGCDPPIAPATCRF